mmetsp:Transcript_51267/g.124927  ORF Transcript_51267/g.124927 Transcript_51267/m.124927 type:complete len:167 (+) Transcript_51267:100-600(+)
MGRRKRQKSDNTKEKRIIARQKKKIKYYEIMKIQKDTYSLTKKNFLIRYIYFRKNNFRYSLINFSSYKKRILNKDVPAIMFAYGDFRYPIAKTSFFMENIIVFFLKNLMSSLTYISFWKLRNRPTVEDLYFFFRNQYEERSQIKEVLTVRYSIEDKKEAEKKKNVD